MLASATRVYHFGVFELNAATRRLFRSGREIRIQEQPLRLLGLFWNGMGNWSLATSCVKSSGLPRRSSNSTMA
jgi:hypothetical protein